MRKMNVVCQDALGANSYIMRSYVNAFYELGHNVVFWEPNNKNPFDLFSEIETEMGRVDLVYLHTWRLNRALVKCLMARPYIKVVCRANHFGDWSCDRDKYPIEFASEQEIELTKTLGEHPNFKNVTCQYPDEFAQKEKTHNGWKKFGLKVTGIPLCTDCSDYYPVAPDKVSEYDVCMVGGAWSYKLQNMARFVYPLCRPEKFKTVICGNGWSGPNAVGRASEETARKLYSSSICSINVHEPHSSFVEDINQRFFHIPSCFGFEVVHKTVGMENFYTKEEMFYVDTPEEMLGAVEYFSNNIDKRTPYIIRGALRTYAEHTNFHRLAEVAKLIDEPELVTEALSKAMEIYELRQKQLVEKFG